MRSDFLVIGRHLRCWNFGRRLAVNFQGGRLWQALPSSSIVTRIFFQGGWKRFRIWTKCYKFM